MATTHYPNYCLILERPHPHFYLFYLSENQPWIGLDYLKILLFHSIHVLVSQVVLTPPKEISLYLLRCKVLSKSGNFPRVFSQVATSQMCPFPSSNFPSLSQPQLSAQSLFQLLYLAPQPILAAAFCPHCSLQCLRGPNLTFGKSPLGKFLFKSWQLYFFFSCPSPNIENQPNLL